MAVWEPAKRLGTYRISEGQTYSLNSKIISLSSLTMISKSADLLCWHEAVVILVIEILSGEYDMLQ